MAVLGSWIGGTTSLLPSTAWAAPNGMFPTEVRNDDAAYGWNAATSTATLPGDADGYLLVGAFELEDTSNGRCNPQCRIVQASGAGAFVGQSSSGYNRDNSEDRSYARCFGFVHGNDAGATFQFQWRRDSDVPSGGTRRSEFLVIPFYYSDIGLYSSNSNACPGNTTPSQMVGFSGTDGANITLDNNVVTVTGDGKRYLVLGGYYWQGIGSSRTQRWGGLRLDGVQDRAAMGYSYARNSANADIGELFSMPFETQTDDRALDLYVYRGDGTGNGQGGASVSGNTTGSNASHALVVIELHDDAELFMARTTTQSDVLAVTGGRDLAVNESFDFIDAGSFSDGTGAIDIEQDGDFLLGANVSCASGNVSNTGRWTGFAEFTVNGVEDPYSFAGDYLRNQQGGQNTFGWSANLLGFQSLEVGDSVGVSVTELPGSEGQGAMRSPAGWTGFWGINLDSLQPSAGLTAVTIESSHPARIRKAVTRTALFASNVRERVQVDHIARSAVRVLRSVTTEHVSAVREAVATTSHHVSNVRALVGLTSQHRSAVRKLVALTQQARSNVLAAVTKTTTFLSNIVDNVAVGITVVMRSRVRERVETVVSFRSQVREIVTAATSFASNLRASVAMTAEFRSQVREARGMTATMLSRVRENVSRSVAMPSRVRRAVTAVWDLRYNLLAILTPRPITPDGGLVVQPVLQETCAMPVPQDIAVEPILMTAAVSELKQSLVAAQVPQTVELIKIDQRQ